jgi:hypothetical protein
MNLLNDLVFYLLIRFWRQLVFASVADIAAALWFGHNATINVLTFAGAFVLAEGRHLITVRRRQRRGLPPLSRWVLIGSTAALCLIPGVALAAAFIDGKQFDSGSSAAAGPTKKPKPPGTHRTVKKLEEAAVDGGVVFGVGSIDHVARVSLVSGPPLTAVPGDKLLLVGTDFAPRDSPAAAFCVRGYGILLVDVHGQRFETVPQEGDVRAPSSDGSPACEELPAEHIAFQNLVFQIPVDDRAAGVVVWDPAEKSDRLGRTYVYFRASRSGPDPDLGATAWGPSRDR